MDAAKTSQRNSWSTWSEDFPQLEPPPVRPRETQQRDREKNRRRAAVRHRVKLFGGAWWRVLRAKQARPKRGPSRRLVYDDWRKGPFRVEVQSQVVWSRLRDSGPDAGFSPAVDPGDAALVGPDVGNLEYDWLARMLADSGGKRGPDRMPRAVRRAAVIRKGQCDALRITIVLDINRPALLTRQAVPRIAPARAVTAHALRPDQAVSGQCNSIGAQCAGRDSEADAGQQSGKYAGVLYDWFLTGPQIAGNVVKHESEGQIRAWLRA